MKPRRVIHYSILYAVAMIAGPASVCAQNTVFINEIVKEERTAGAGAVTPDTREFIELYNSGASAVDISNWSIVTTPMNTGIPITDTLPASQSIPAGGYYVIAKQGGAVVGANHYIPIAPTEELYADLANLVIELQDSTSTLRDAVGFDTFRDPQVTLHTPAQLAQTGNGIWGQAQSYNIPVTADFKRLSIARYRDGRDSNVNGRDFGFLPITQGASNNTLPLNAVHTVPNVTALAHGANVPNYNYGFVPVRAINPSTVDIVNPSAIPDSPRNGGRVMVMWDETGGGNSAYSKELVNKFDIYAFFDARPLNLPGDWEAEYTSYGIGTTEPLFGTPNPHGFTGPPATRSQNSNTGIGWLYERFQPAEGSDVFRLSLVDFGEGGNSVAGSPDLEWDVKATFDLTSGTAAWHRLGIDYNPTTGEVVATFGSETRNFTTATNLLGTFYVGYREALTAVPGANNGIVRPATFDLVSLAPTNNANFDTTAGSLQVDGRDFLIWQRNTGGAGTQATGDANGNNLVNDADFATWKLQYGTTPAGVNAAAVPEPVGGLLLGFGALGLLMARRSR